MFKTLPLPRLLRLRRRSKTQHPITNANRTSAPRTDPTTIPAICPAVRPCPLVPFGEAVLVGIGNTGGIDVVMARWTLAHRCSVWENRQQASVLLGELAAQYVHRPPKLLENPQLSGSFSAPWIHDCDSEPWGRAQFVKSARISETAFDPLVPHI